MANFRVSSRTVDMLGRQQIAGIPTAISELFKNAHDAYASTAEVDYYRQDGLFVLRDDGLGMTRQDFEERWLTLGTESKIGSARLSLPPVDPSKDLRPVLGEKGIGRLAIAIIGRQVLVLTRAKKTARGNNNLIVAYIHWGLFELPGLNLEEINVPIREFEGDLLPNSEYVRELVGEAISFSRDIEKQTDTKAVREIVKEMKGFDVDPSECAAFLGEPSLSGGQSGTHFYIKPADPILKDDIDTRESDSNSTGLERNLIGFTNTMTPKHATPAILTSFRDHRDLGGPIELIGEKSFFTPEEFREVDHHFHGKFDRNGQFKGTVAVYQTKPENYVLNWNEFDGKPTECGPFSLAFAYMQGAARDSLVAPDEHARMKKKLDRFGGLYIYRDGIRVQPYGDSDYDWLDIERNRTLGASYYFYSYRRMFGTIEIDHKRNSALTEKAGREGFRENKAYRQMRSILKNFFLQTAADFFREGGELADIHAIEKEEINRLEQVRRRQSKLSSQRKAEFRRSLNLFFENVEQQIPETKAAAIVESAQSRVDKLLSGNQSNQRKAVALMKLEQGVRDELYDLRESLNVVKPRGVGLSKALSNEWNAYLTKIDSINANILDSSEEEIEEYVSGAARKARVPLDDVSRLNAVLTDKSQSAVKSARKVQTDIGAMANESTSRFRELARESFAKIDIKAKSVLADMEVLQKSDKGIAHFSEVREKMERDLIQVRDQELEKLNKLRNTLLSVSVSLEPDGYAADELAEALEEELEVLKESRDSDLEMVQVGLAISTISHEFDKTVGSLRDGFRQLKSWADVNPDIRSLYQNMRISFDHLDSYLTLFTPLDRRLQRAKVEISGAQIFDFLEKLFETRLDRHKVELKASKKFSDHIVLSYPSSIYPPFVNLVDNSIFWLQRKHDGKRTITLDVDGADMLIRDNGVGVGDRDVENVFRLNFSRKPGGRGMGLYISRKTLEKEGFTLTLDRSRNDAGATFRISSTQG